MYRVEAINKSGIWEKILNYDTDEQAKAAVSILKVFNVNARFIEEIEGLETFMQSIDDMFEPVMVDEMVERTFYFTHGYFKKEVSNEGY